SFFTENQSGWNSKNNSNPIRIVCDKDEVALRITIDEKAKKGDKILFRFGLLASPVKPLPKNYPFDIFGSFKRKCLGQKGNDLHKLKNKNIKAYIVAPYDDNGAGFFDDRLNYTGKYRLPQSIANALSNAKKTGTHVMPYFGNDVLPEDYKETRYYLKEWERRPAPHFQYKRTNKDGKKEGYLNYWLCPKSTSKDFFAWGISDLLKRQPGLSGLYFDFGPAHTCSNKLHGCESNGFPILAQRAFYRAIAGELYNAGIKDYSITVHNSQSVQLASFTFITHMFNGENYRYMTSDALHDGRDFLDSISLPIFQIEMSSLPWGITSNMYTPTVYLPAKYWKTRKQDNLPDYFYRLSRSAMTPIVLHNSLPGIHRFHPDYAVNVVGNLAAFDIREAEFLPYWRNKDLVSTTTGNAKISAYKKQNGDYLFVVANLGSKRTNIKLSINLDTSLYNIKELLGETEAEIINVEKKSVEVEVEGHAIALMEFRIR
ncbi:MAG: glycoside hydrolase domain-containing protein, partial [Planctomycetota bacterium]